MSPQLKKPLQQWIPKIKWLALATSMIVGLAVSESVWAQASCSVFGAGYYCSLDHVIYSTQAACHTACSLPPPTSTYTLTLNTTGTGTGTVSGGGTYPEGTKVDLVATAATGSTFAGWSSGCSSGMALTANTTCTATFNKGDSTPTPPSTPPLPENMTVFVQVDGNGSGSVSTDTGLSCQREDCQPNAAGELVCQENCRQIVKTASDVTLTPKADANSVFSSWGGNPDCVDGKLTTITSSTLCTAYFHRLYKLTVTVDGPGIVTGKTLGYDSKLPINCGQGQTQCNNTYKSTIADSLQAQPLGNAQFQGWSGDCSGSQTPVALNLSKDATCQATFIDPTTVKKLDQTITNFSPATPAGVGEATLTATGGASGNPVTFASTTPEVCTVSGNILKMVKAGTCTVTADQAGNEKYNAATQVTKNITVNSPAKLDQVITNFSPATPVMVNSTSTLTATGGDSGNPVKFASTTQDICTVDASGQVTFKAAGTCTVTADQDGNDQYNAAITAKATIQVNAPVEPQVKKDQVITNFSPNAYAFTVEKAMVNGTATLAATGGASGNPVIYNSTTPEICTVSGNTVSLLAVGTCNLTANQEGNDLYNPALPVTTAIQVNPPVESSKPTTSNWSLVTTSTVGKSLTLTATGETAVTFTSTTPTVCTISGNLANFIGEGTCTVTANQAGNDQYNPAPQVTANITINNPTKQDQIITHLATTGRVGDQVILKATGGNSGNPVTFTTTTPAVCAISSNVVTFVAVGTCTIIANQAGNDQYQAASPEVTHIEISAQVGQPSQPITDSSASPVATPNPLNCEMTETAGITTIRGFCDAQGKILSTPLVIDRNANLKNVVIASSVDNQGWISNSKITSTGIVKGGTLTGQIDNQGIVQDFEFRGSSFIGGTVGGNIQNTSTVGGCLQDVTLLPNTTITGGCLDGTIKDDPNFPATLENVKIKGGGLVTEVTPPEDTGVLSNDQLHNLDAETLGQLSLETISLLTATDLANIPPEAFSGLTAAQLAALNEEAITALTPEQMVAIPPDAMTGLTAEQLAVLDEATVAVIAGEQLAPIPPETFSGITPAQVSALSANALASLTPSQFLYVPTTAVNGLTAQNMGDISTGVISRFTSNHLAALNTDQFQQLPNTDIGKWLNNLDQTRIEGAQMETLIPSDWQWNPTTGALTPPVGTILQFKPLSPTEEPTVPVVLPNLPNLKTSFGIAGEGEQFVEDSMQLTLDQVDLSQFMLSQDEQGILQVRGTGEFEGVNFAFIPDAEEMIQVDSEIPIGLETIEGGFFRMTTPDSQQFKIIPAPSNPKGLSEVLGGGAVIVGKRGDVFMEVSTNLRQAGEAREVAMFDPLIEPAPAEYCEEIAGETVCDFDKAPPENRPGIRTIPANGSRVRDVPSKKVVYPNGTAQVIRPTVLSPDTFINVGTGFDGVEKVQLNAKGTFIVSHQGNKYLITPNFGPKSRPVGQSEQIEPSIELNATTGHLTYTVVLDPLPQTATGTTRTRQVRDSEAREVLEFDSLIEPVPEETCEEVKGEIICETP